MTVVTHSYAVLIVMIFIAGVGVAAFHPEGYKFAGLASQERRATGMSYFSVGGNVGIGLGPAAVSIAVATWGAYGFSYIIPISVAAAIVLWYIVLPWAAAQPRVQFRVPAPAGGRVAASASIATGAVGGARAARRVRRPALVGLDRHVELHPAVLHQRPAPALRRTAASSPASSSAPGRSAPSSAASPRTGGDTAARSSRRWRSCPRFSG